MGALISPIFLLRRGSIMFNKLEFILLFERILKILFFNMEIINSVLIKTRNTIRIENIQSKEY
ncbi:hypothetical protein DKE45_020795 (plasmid) [Acinetobacter pittii]|nr:hypothetical protein DKE45_020795 [Acinetobacter pittii]